VKVVIKTKNLRLTKTLKSFVEEKVNSLEKFLKIFQPAERFNHFLGSPAQILKNKTWVGKGKPRIEAWVEIGKISLRHKKGPYFWAECQMRLPGKSLRSTARSKDLKLAITKVKDELQRELKEYKEKLTALTKRRQRALKKLLKISPQARFWRKGRIREEGI